MCVNFSKIISWLNSLNPTQIYMNVFLSATQGNRNMTESLNDEQRPAGASEVLSSTKHTTIKVYARCSRIQLQQVDRGFLLPQISRSLTQR
jgi:hypothetical protein